jgi:hypothetical protein
LLYCPVGATTTSPNPSVVSALTELLHPGRAAEEVDDEAEAEVPRPERVILGNSPTLPLMEPKAYGTAAALAAAEERKAAAAAHVDVRIDAGERSAGSNRTSPDWYQVG